MHCVCFLYKNDYAKLKNFSRKEPQPYNKRLANTYIVG